MKKEKLNKKIILLSLILISFIITNIFIVTAKEINNKYLEKSLQIKYKGLAGAFSNFFSKEGWQAGQVEANIGKIFFFAMITIIIYLIIGNIFGSSKTGWMFILSVLISFLATAYLTPEDIYSVINSYTALGLTITTMIPIAVLFALTYRASTANEGQTTLIMIQYIAWILFGAYSIYRFIYEYWWQETETASLTTGWIVVAAALLSAGMVIFNKQIIHFLVKKEIEAKNEAINKKTAEAGNVINALDKLGEKLK
ncbi:MAG: hypothetical protein QXW97_02545 [Candidatus Pacearchaeota archaeon]